MAYFCLKLKMYEFKIYRGVMCHENEEWCKNWKGINLPVQNWHKKFDEFWSEHSKISKNCILRGEICTLYLNLHLNLHFICFWTKYIMFELKKSLEKLCLMTLNIAAKFEGTMTYAFKNDMRNWANFHQSVFEV